MSIGPFRVGDTIGLNLAKEPGGRPERLHGILREIDADGVVRVQTEIGFTDHEAPASALIAPVTHHSGFAVNEFVALDALSYDGTHRIRTRGKIDWIDADGRVRVKQVIGAQDYQGPITALMKTDGNL